MSSGRRKSQQELRERMEAAVDAFEGESDRAIPLIGQEWLNDGLAELLYANFSAHGASNKVQGGLLKSVAAPLGTFSVRVKVCGAFGLLPQNICAALDDFRRVRNYCAHGIEAVSLSDTDIQGSVRSLREIATAQMGILTFEQFVRHATTKAGVKDSRDFRDEARKRSHEHVVAQNVSDRSIIIVAAGYLSGYIRGAANQIAPQDFHVDIPPALPPLEDPSKPP